MSKKILIVEDEPDILDLATARLKSVGYEIIEAVDAEVAEDILRERLPDLILLDLLLPKMQGDELCKKLKSDDRYKHIPIVLFTASVIRTSLPIKVKEMGADDCIIKPFEPETLLAMVKKYIG